jgi:hypothetical protein
MVPWLSRFGGMQHVDMRSLTPAAQEERRRQVIGLRKRGLTYEAIARQVGLTRNGVFAISLMFVVYFFRRDGTTSAGHAKGHGG